MLIVVAVFFAGAWGGQPRRSGVPPPRTPIPPPPEAVARARLDLLERWLKAVDQHVPGQNDAPLRDVASWTNGELRTLWIDVNAVVQIMRNPRTSVSVRPEGASRSTTVRFTRAQILRLNLLACAASGGILIDVECRLLDAANEIDEPLRRLAAHAAAERLRHDYNYLLRRAALLHADVASLSPPGPVEPYASTGLGGLQRFKIEISDGRQMDVGSSPVHWEIARMVLSFVIPPGMDKPAPGRDAMVRQWYRATAAWMQFTENHEPDHLEYARELFPDDPDLLFLSGCGHETYGAPHIQAVVQSAFLPSGVSLGVGSDRSERRQAETFFRRALAVKPEFVEARLRLGRVLGLLGRHEEAASELRQAAAQADEPLMRYYGALYLGAEEETLGRYDAALAAYEQAAALFPTAQSPLLAQSELARRRGDRAAALRALQRLFELPPTQPERDDPWWAYYVAQARNVDDLLADLRRPFLGEHDR
jgi:tetratricopeptide (TPR) repeat protein